MSLRVLVVDDNAEIRGTLQTFLQLAGHAVETADCGQAALARLRESAFDVVLLDLGLPDLDGYRVAEQVGALGLVPRPRLVAITGSVEPRHREHARRAGFDVYLPKPVSGRTLLRAVEDE